MERRGAFDYILLETSGLADPGNIAPLFWVDDGLGSTIYLDGIVTLVDAKNILQSLDEMKDCDSAITEDIGETHGIGLSTAHLQVSHADIIILNKADTVSSEQLKKIQERLQRINSLARIEITEYGKVPQLEQVILDIHAYDKVDSLDTTHTGHNHLDPVSNFILHEIDMASLGLR